MSVDPDFQINDQSKDHIRGLFKDWLHDLDGECMKLARNVNLLPDVGEAFGDCVDGHKLKATAEASGAKAVQYVRDLRSAVQAYWEATEEVWKAYERTDEGAGAAVTSAMAQYAEVQKLMPRDFAPILPNVQITGF